MWVRLIPAALFLSSAAACGGGSSEQTPARTSTEERREHLNELEPSRVVFAMGGNESEIRKCFFRAPGASGFVRVGFEVEPSGVVKTAAVERSTVENADVEACLTSRVRDLRFGQLAIPGRAHWTYVYRLAEPLSEKEKKKNKKKHEAGEFEDEPGIVIEPSSEGFVEPNKIDEVVQSGYKLFAHCYRAGIDRDTALQGTIRLRFVIDGDGKVSNVLDGASDLPDRRVLDCVAESFYALEFPEPNGNVKVMYRLVLN